MSLYKLHLTESSQKEIFESVESFINDWALEDSEDVRDIPAGFVVEELTGIVRIVMGK